MFDNSREHSHATRRAFLAGATAGTGATLVALPAAALGAGCGQLDAGEDWPDGPGRANRPQAPDAELRSVLRQVDRRRIEANVRTLASFGTRHTLSSQDDPTRGIGAARDWIFATMTEYAAAAGGRMTVEKQSYLQEPDGERIPTPTTITNVLATLRQRPARSGLRHLGSLRLARQRRHELHRRRARSRRRRIRGGGLDGAGAGVRHPPTAGHAGLRGGGWRGTGPLRRRPHGAGVPGRGRRRPGHVHQRHRRQLHSRRRHPRPAEHPALRGGRSHRGYRGRGERPPIRGRRERLTRATARPPRHRGRRQPRHRHADPGDLPPRPLPARWRPHPLPGRFPAARFTEPHEDYRHQHQDVRVENGVQFGDLPEFCDFGFIAGVARVNAATLWSLAMAPGTPKNAAIDTSALDNNTALSWDAVEGAAGYEVVWRPTIEDDWAHVIRVNGTSATVDLSKDNVFFAVRSVDAQGRHSPAAFPTPQFD